MNLGKVFNAFSCYPDVLTIFSNNETTVRFDINHNFNEMISFVEMNREAIVTDFFVFFDDCKNGFELEITINKN